MIQSVKGPFQASGVGGWWADMWSGMDGESVVDVAGKGAPPPCYRWQDLTVLPREVLMQRDPSEVARIDEAIRRSCGQRKAWDETSLLGGMGPVFPPWVKTLAFVGVAAVVLQALGKGR